MQGCKRTGPFQTQVGQFSPCSLGLADKKEGEGHGNR